MCLESSKEGAHNKLMGPGVFICHLGINITINPQVIHLKFLSEMILTGKKNGTARLDPWEIFVLLALKIPFHFISLRKLENYLQFYMTIAFKLNRTKKKVNHKFEIAFNFKKEIPLKCFLSPLGILYPLGG